MEIVVAVLLFFGGFTFGSINADKGDEGRQSTMALANTDSAPDSQPVTQAVQQCNPFRCHADGTHLYRDLTVPYPHQVDLQARQTGACEENRDYLPAASPPSTGQGCTNAAITGRNRATMAVECADE